MIQLKGIEKIYIASDHAGYPLKERIIKDYLIKKKLTFPILGLDQRILLIILNLQRNYVKKSIRPLWEY